MPTHIMQIPNEVLIAKEVYYEAYNKIKAKVRENSRKYIGTKYEDCPPLIKEQGQFFVKRARILEAREMLTSKYGEHPSTWDYWVAYYETKSAKENTVQKKSS